MVIVQVVVSQLHPILVNSDCGLGCGYPEPERASQRGEEPFEVRQSLELPSHLSGVSTLTIVALPVSKGQSEIRSSCVVMT